MLGASLIRLPFRSTMRVRTQLRRTTLVLCWCVRSEAELTNRSETDPRNENLK